MEVIKIYVPHPLKEGEVRTMPLNENDVQMAPTYLFFIILIGIMIRIMKDAKGHFDQNLSFCYNLI